MTCARWEEDLALHVEGDLDRDRARAVEAHLDDCAACRDFLGELRTSQLALSDLAAEPLDPGRLDSLRARVATELQRPTRPSVPWRLAVAASLAAAAAALLWIGIRAVVVPREARVAASPASPRRAPEDDSSPARSTPPGVSAPSRPSVTRATRARSDQANQRPPSAAVPSLSPDDADQLARAVLSVSRIESVEQGLRATAPTDPAPTSLMRIATSDPDVVIYWRLEPNGGD